MSSAGIQIGLYQHFKGNQYWVYGTAEHSETGELLVICHTMSGEGKVYAIPLAMFTETVNRDGYHGPRFAFVEP